MSQITTCTFFKLESFSNKLWAFSQMQLGHAHFKNIEGLEFYKLLDYLISQGDVDPIIGSLTCRAEIKYGLIKPNSFCHFNL
jgi:hypothetical protein